jgi:LPXTG-motif cell wall-anchored protein
MKRMHSSSIARFSLALGLAAALAASRAVVSAGVWDKRTTVSFSQPVEVPGYVLQPGQYVMKLVDFQANRHVVQFMNTQGNHVYAAAIAIPAYRAEATDKTVISFYEARPGQPEPMRYWYYPGENVGEEFVYPKDRLAEIAAVTHEATPAAFVARSQVNSGPVAAAEPVKDEIPAPVASEPAAPIAAATAPAEANAPVEIAQTAPPRQEAPAASTPIDTPAAPSELPKTGSDLAEIALLGVVFIGGAVAARKLRRA